MTCAILVAMTLMLGTEVAVGATSTRWVEARSTHFVVMTDSGENNARRLAIQFERMHLVFHALLPSSGDDAEQPIAVIALKDRKGMRALEPVEYLGKDQIDLAGFFLSAPDKNYILLRMDAQEGHAYANVYHEYTHYVLRKAGVWLPLWLNEGLAQFYENTDINEKRVYLGQGNGEQLKLLARNDLLPIAKLMTIEQSSDYYHEEQGGSIFYAESWALTHYLITSDRIQGTHRIHNYADLLAKGEGAASAAREAFGDLDKLQTELSDYVLQQKFMYFMMPAMLTAKDQNVAVRSVSTAEANSVQADVMVYTNRVAEARALVDDVLRTDAGVPLTHETLGTLLYREGSLEQAKQQFRVAQELDPQSYLARYYFAMAALRSGATGDDQAVEASLEESIALNPQFAPSYDALAMFYASRHRNLERAHQLNLQAVRLDADCLSFRLNCAQVLTEQRRFEEALAVLEEAKRVAKNSTEREAVVNGIGRVEGYQSAAKTVGAGS